MCGGPLAGSALPGLLACGACSFTTADLTVSDAELARLYGPEYFAGQEYMDYFAERPLIHRHFKTRLDRLLRYVADPRSKRLFEIGSAYGFFLEVARECFRSVEGIDISVAAAVPPRPAGPPGDRRRVSDPRDVWSRRHRLPLGHYRAPSRSALVHREGGLVPPSGRSGRADNRRHRQLDGALARRSLAADPSPTHLHYFSKPTLTRLLERHGFTVAYAGYDGMYRSVDTMAYILLNIKQSRPRVYGALKKAGLLNWNLYLNLYDIVYMIATKK